MENGHTVTGEPQLRNIIGPPKEGATAKIADRLNDLTRQCPKALIRSELWNRERHIDRSELPSSGKILRSLTEAGFDADAYDRERAKRYARREGFY